MTRKRCRPYLPRPRSEMPMWILVALLVLMAGLAFYVVIIR